MNKLFLFWGTEMNRITYAPYYSGLPVNTNWKKQEGSYIKILEIIHEHYADMILKHSKVFSLRFDLSWPKDRSVIFDPKQIYVFHENLTKDLNRNYPILSSDGKIEESATRYTRKVDPRIIKVYEMGQKSGKPHVHGLLLVNGNAKDSSADLYARIERQWANVLGLKDAKGLVDYCNRRGPNSYMICRNDREFEKQWGKAFYQASYLAKVKDKAGLPKGHWLVSATRLPRDAKTAFNINNNNPSDEV